MNPYCDDMSDYDTDDADHAILPNNSYLNLHNVVNVMDSTTNNMAAESGDGEGLYDFDDATIKRRSDSHKTKKRKNQLIDMQPTSSVNPDLLPTPTNTGDWSIHHNAELVNICDKNNRGSDNAPSVNDPSDNDPSDNDPSDNDPSDNDPSDNDPSDTTKQCSVDSMTTCDNREDAYNASSGDQTDICKLRGDTFTTDEEFLSGGGVRDSGDGAEEENIVLA